MVIAADNQSPGSTKGQAGPAGSVWLGIAVGLANSMKLYLHNQADRTGGNDPDSDEKLARRIWWSLVIMDRWHSLGTSSPVMVPDGSVVVYPEDESLLGEPLFHLARKGTHATNESLTLTRQACRSLLDTFLLPRLPLPIFLLSVCPPQHLSARSSEVNLNDGGSPSPEVFSRPPIHQSFTSVIGLYEF
jgi:hypothetical protein